MLVLTEIGKTQTNIGLPLIKNFPKEEYLAGLQNWDIDQDQSGKMYFANNQGLLIFDGVNWTLLPVVNNTIVRSLLVDGARIYVGSQGEVGYFEPDEKGKLVYHSLKHKMPEAQRNFNDVWQIISKDQDILFRTTRQVFSFNKNTLDTINRITELKNIQSSKLHLHTLGSALSKIEKPHFEILSNHPSIKGDEITGIVPLGQHLLVATYKSGVFLYNYSLPAENEKILTPWTINDSGFIQEHRITNCLRINKDRIVLGTSFGGLCIVNNQGKIIQHLHIDNGLQSNDIINVFKDHMGNLWLALGNGISYIEINSPFSIIKPDKNKEGTGYASIIHNDKIYFGLSNGLYSIDWKNYYHPLDVQPFQLIKGTKGQVWNLNSYNNELLLSHHEGTFRINDNLATQMSNLTGSWEFISLKNEDQILLEGNYNGLSLYQFQNGHWTFKQQIEQMIQESCRILVQDKAGNIWVAHPYRGVFRIELDESYQKIKTIKLYDENNGFPSKWVNVFEIGGEVVFSSQKGLYTYNNKLDTFEILTSLSEIIDPNSQIQQLIEDHQGNIWFVIDNEVGVIKVENYGFEKKLTKKIFPNLKDKLVGGFEHIYPFDNRNVFFALEKGFMHFNPEKTWTPDTLFNTHFHEISLGDSIIYGNGWVSPPKFIPTFNYRQNAFTFKYAASAYNDMDNVVYQFMMVGLDESWSPWLNKTEKEYTELKHGSYEFKVRAKNIYGQLTFIKTFAFAITPPWYLTLIAKTTYWLVGLLALVALIIIPRRKFEQEKATLAENQEKTLQEASAGFQKIVEKTQAEISELQKEKYNAEIQFKNKELATATMHLVQKGELLNKLKERLNKMLNDTSEPEFKKSIKSTLRLINQNSRIDEDWERFSNNFDQVHVDFLKRLSAAYPHLTPKDQRMCTYLKMNLTTKEIVPLMNISVRGVEVGRYRLRKKLGLDSSVNLNEFMMRF